MKSHIRKQSIRKFLCIYYVRIFPFSLWAPMSSQISLSRFHEKSVSKLLPEVEVISLWDELTEQKDVSQIFFHVLNGWNFLYQRRPQCDPKKHFSCSSKTVLIYCKTKHKCNSVRWIHTSPNIFWESFFLGFICGYFLCHRKVHCAMKYLIADFQKTVITNWSL